MNPLVKKFNDLLQTNTQRIQLNKYLYFNPVKKRTHRNHKQLRDLEEFIEENSNAINWPALCKHKLFFNLSPAFVKRFEKRIDWDSLFDNWQHTAEFKYWSELAKETNE